MIPRWSVVALLTCAALLVTGASAHAALPFHAWSVGAWPACVQTAGPVSVDCEQHATSRIGGADDATLLLPFYTLTMVQSDAIQDAHLRLRLVGPAPLPTVRVLVHRIAAWWSPGEPASLPTTWDPDPVVVATPDADGAIDVDVTRIVDAWARDHATARTDGVPNHGFAIRVAYLGANGLRPAIDVGATANTDPDARPALDVASWPSVWHSEINAMLGPFESIAADEVGLSIRTVESGALTGRLQYLAGETTHWTDVPLAQLRDHDGQPLSSVEVPFGPHGSAGAVWDVGATLALDGLVRVRALVDHRLGHDAGATDETFFVLDRPGVDEAPTDPSLLEPPPVSPVPPTDPPVLGPDPVAADPLDPSAPPGSGTRRRAADSCRRTPDRRETHGQKSGAQSESQTALHAQRPPPGARERRVSRLPQSRSARRPTAQPLMRYASAYQM